MRSINFLLTHLLHCSVDLYGYKRIRNRVSVKIWKTRHKISADIRTFFTVHIQTRVYKYVRLSCVFITNLLTYLRAVYAGRRVEADDTRRVSTTEATRLRRRRHVARDRSTRRQNHHRHLAGAQARTGDRDIQRPSRPLLLPGTYTTATYST